MSRKKQNILFIQTDQHRQDALGCYGNPVIQTPNIDALAEEGVRFNQAFCCTGICTASRGALLSGQYPHKTRENNQVDPVLIQSFNQRSIKGLAICEISMINGRRWNSQFSGHF